MADGRLPESPLRGRVFDWLGISQIADILPRIHDRGLPRAEIAAFAPEVIALANSGDVAATAILESGARLLAEMVEANYRLLPTGRSPQVVITGGLGSAKTIYRERIVAETMNRLPAAEIHEPKLPPALGAALLAMEQAGHPNPNQLLEKLKDICR
jgi:N-acetylglucosamine kinase-like BadF-type ATPase